MAEDRLKKLAAELEKARAKYAEWGARVKALEQKYREAENTCIHEMVHAASITPEQLALILKQARSGTLIPKGVFWETSEGQDKGNEQEGENNA